ncbi:MAG: metallopeptidase family protein [Bacillales bacterium]|nr:metallopeptidase family protein [Bacillales bacterium]
MNNRLKKLHKWMLEKNIDSTIISSTENVFYLTGFHCNPHERLLALIVYKNADPIIIVPKMEEKSVISTGWSYDIIAYDDTENPWDKVKNRFHSINCIGIEKTSLNVSKYEEIQRISKSDTFINVEEILNELRLIKDSEEISIMRDAAHLADIGVEIGISAITKGKSELQIISIIESELKLRGVQKMSFDTMVLAGPNSAEPHGVPSLNKICDGDLVLFDLGVIHKGYCSDISRTVAFKSISEKQREIYDTVLQAQLKAIEISNPGTLIKDVDLAARDHIKSFGLGEYFTHRVGHGLGILIHEYPSMHSLNEGVLKEGMVFTIEPGIYIPDVGGVRIEDDIVITPTGNEVLTKFTKELLIIK